MKTKFTAQGRAALSTADKNALPDSSFAIILPGGRKDAEGKTTPRDLRKLPYKDANGKVMLEQAYNAIAVLNGARGGLAGVSNAQKASAWNKIVAAIKTQNPQYQPPPRKF